MKVAIGALSGLLMVGLYCVQPAQAQGWQGYQTTPAQPYGYQTAPAPRYGERREQGYGSGVNERCIGLHRESENLRARMDRAWNPIEHARMEGHLNELRERQAREGCR